MRWSLLGIAALLGAFSITLIGGGTACVATDAGTGGTAAASSSSTVFAVCDTGSCDACRECASLGACAMLVQECGADEYCAQIDHDIGACQVTVPPDPNCLAEACGPSVATDPIGTALYMEAAQCVFEAECLISCTGLYYPCNDTLTQ
jgi:hypothetical protein